MDDNPYTLLRTYLKLTQDQVARMAKTTEQYVRRQEYGLVSSDSPALSNALYHAAQKRNIDLSLPAYKALRDLRTHSKKNYIGPTSYHNAQTFEKLLSAWYDFWLQAKRELITPSTLSEATTLFGLCRILLVHPYVVQNYQRRLSQQPESPEFVSFPEPVTRALNDANIDRSVFMEALERLRG